MDRRKDIRSSPKRSKKPSKYSRQNSHRTRSSAKRDRGTLERRSYKTGCCHNAERCKGIGAVLITLAIPSSISGLILTVVAATDDDNDNKYPDSFLAVGPILLVLAVILFISGLCLYSPYIGKIARQFVSLDEPTSLCRVHCPKFSQWLRPDETIVINQAAMKALQTEPGRPVLKRNRLPTMSSEDGENPALSRTTSRDDSEGHSHPSSKGVHFSENEVDDKDRPTSPSESGSTLSLRHCKISPKTENDKIWWTDEARVKTIVEQPNGEATLTTEL